MLDRPPPARHAALSALTAIVGDRHVVTAEGDTAGYLVEQRGLYRGRAAAVVRPASTAEVAAVMRIATEHRLPVVAQGGNTGLVGGQIPDMSGGAIVLSLRRLDRIREVDPVTDTLTVEAGVTLQRARQAADEAGRLFPLVLPSEGSCTIGGNLAANAGGAATIAYGNTRDLVLGIEAVLADGRVMNLMGKLRKDNTGYDLRNLLIGSEGTLGIITAAVLKLFPRPRSIATAFCGLADPAAALALLARAKGQAGGGVASFEILPRIGVDFVTRHIAGARDPLSTAHPWYVLIEVALQEEGAAVPLLETILAEAIEAGVVADATLAASLDQRAALWKLRETMTEAQKPEGGSIKHDVSVPVASVPAFIAEADAAVTALVPGCRPVPFGHAGDGNVHYNLSQPVGADPQAFLDRWYEVNAAVHAVVARHGGSISAEHGIGVMKRDLLPGVKDPVALEVMRAIKRTLDPLGILNPGKVL